MASSFSTEGPRLVIKFPKPIGTVFAGLVFAAIGAAVVYFDVPVKDAPPWTLDAVGGVVGALGLIAALYRHGAILDNEQQTVRRWSGLLVPMFSSVRRVLPRHVRLHTEVYRRKGHTHTWYPIDLVCEGGKILLGQPVAVMQAWAIAQAVSSHFGVELVDETVASGALAC